jgi:uncharacterized protein YoxC
MNLKKWFNRTLREKLLDILEELAGHFKNQQGQPDWRKAVEVFTQFCNNSLQLTPPQQELVTGIIKTLKLTREVDALRDFWQKIPEPLRDLSKSLENDSEAIVWKLLGTDNKELSWGNMDGPLGSIIGFKALASLDLSLQALDNGTAAGVIGLSCGEDERFLKLGLAGKLDVDTPGGTSILGFIAGKGSADTTGSGCLDYYFRDKAEWLFLEALAHNLPHLASPFAAAEIAAEQAHRLSALQLSAAGSLNTSLGLGIDRAWGASFHLKDDSPELDSDISLGVQLSAGLQADLSLKGTWKILVKPLANRILSVKVQEDRSKDKHTGFSLGVQVGLGGLDAVGDALIKKYLPDPAGLLAKLTQFSNFGSLLKAKVKAQLEQWLKAGEGDTLKDELAAFLVGDDNAAALAEVIGSAAEIALNNQLELLTEKAGNAGQKIVQDIANQLNLPAELSRKLVDKAEKEMNHLLDHIKGQLEDRLRTLITLYQGKLATLFKPLESIGEAVTDLTASLDQLSQRLLEPVIHLLTKYQQQRNKIVKVVREAANLKLGLQFSHMLASTAEKNTVLEFEIDTGKEKAREYYQEMVAGNVANALAAARGDKDGTSGIRLMGGSFQDHVTSKYTTDMNFDVFGAQINAKTVLNSDVQVRLDTAGNILVAESTASMDKTFSAFGKSWEVTFINMLELPGTESPKPGESGGLPKGETKLFTSSLSLTYQDLHLKKKELDAFLGSLESTALVGQQTLTAVNRRYDELASQASSEGKKLGGKISLGLSLTAANIETLLNTDDQVIRRTAIANQVKTYFKDPRKREAFDGVLAKWYDRSGDETGQIEKIAAVGALGVALSRYDISNIDERRDQATVPPLDLHYLHMAHRIGKNAANLVEMTRNMRCAAALRFTQANLDEEVKKLDQYNKINEKLLKEWLKIRGLLSSLGIKPESIPPVTLAFIATIGELCHLGKEGTPFLTPMVAWSVQGWSKPEIFV